jgi:hypothetical protein
MLAPDASVGKAEKNSDLAVCDKISIDLTWALKFYFADSLFFDSCITVFELSDGVTANWSAFKTHINAEEKSRWCVPKPRIHTLRSSVIDSAFTLSFKSIVYSSAIKYGRSLLVRAPIFNTTYLQNKPINI